MSAPSSGGGAQGEPESVFGSGGAAGSSGVAAGSSASSWGSPVSYQASGPAAGAAIAARDRSSSWGRVAAKWAAALADDRGARMRSAAPERSVCDDGSGQVTRRSGQIPYSWP
jgi:hypothetical protein